MLSAQAHQAMGVPAKAAVMPGLSHAAPAHREKGASAGCYSDPAGCKPETARMQQQVDQHEALQHWQGTCTCRSPFDCTASLSSRHKMGISSCFNAGPAQILQGRSPLINAAHIMCWSILPTGSLAGCL